jgi:hypothetical protein
MSPAIFGTTVLSEDEIARVDALAAAQGVTREVMIDKLFRGGIDALAMAQGVTREVMIDKLFRASLEPEELRGDLEMGSVELVALAEGDRG